MAGNTDTLAALGDGGDATRVLAGDCSVVYDGDGREEYRGHVTVLVKPDNTVLVHDASGYQPVAWLTRADAVSCVPSSPRTGGGAADEPVSATGDTSRGGATAAVDSESSGRAGPPHGSEVDDSSGSGEATTRVEGAATDRSANGRPATARATTDARRADDARGGAVAGGFAVDARDGDERLLVRAHGEDGYVAFPTTRAGRPVGTCPECSGTLVRASGAVTCVGCGREHGLPDGATVRDERCDCGYPRLRVERGAPLSVCLDRQCEPVLAAVRERFDREWSCPRCGSDLRVLRRGGLIAGCERYPDCDASFSIPVGTVVDECDCGLPVFETARSRRCLDASCEQRSGSESA